MKIVKIGSTIIICIFLIFVTLIAGCSQGSGGGYSPQILPQAELHVNLANSESHWSLGMGCYWTASGTAYNSGSATSDNGIVTLQLINSNSGTIKDSKSISVGRLAPGESQTFEATLDGDCSGTYSTRATIR